MTVGRRALVLLALAGPVLLAGAGSAFAHSALIDSEPVDGASMAGGPQQVSLTFSDAVQPGFSDVTVVGPNGRQWQAADPSAQGAVVTVPVRPLGPAGRYTIGYRVLSADSHPVQGSISFTLTRDGAPATATGNPAEAGGGAPVWPWIVGAGILLAVGVVVARRVGRSH